MDFLIKLFNSFTKFFKTTTPVVHAEDAEVNKVLELKTEVGNVEVKTEPAKKAPAKKAPKSPAKSEVAQKRTRKGGKFVGDDKSTPDVNEAFKDGKAPGKKNPKLKVEK